MRSLANVFFMRNFIFLVAIEIIHHTQKGPYCLQDFVFCQFTEFKYQSIHLPSANISYKTTVKLILYTKVSAKQYVLYYITYVILPAIGFTYYNSSFVFLIHNYQYKLSVYVMPIYCIALNLSDR